MYLYLLALGVVGRSGEVEVTWIRTSEKAPSAQLGIYEKRCFALQQTMGRWRASSESFARSVPLQHHSPAQR
jgi:hypothetical protein